MNLQYLEAPNYHAPGTIADRDNTVFLAGSITGASDWQKNAATRLIDAGFTVFNPRRENYSTFDPAAEREQITWEHFYLELAGIHFFYFAPETVAPITLFEYGAILTQIQYSPWKKLYVAIHPEYKRKNDVIIQTELRNPAVLDNIFIGEPNDAISHLIADNV